VALVARFALIVDLACLNPLSSGDGFVAYTVAQGDYLWKRLNPLSSGDGFAASVVSADEPIPTSLNPLSSGDGFVASSASR